MGRFVTGIVTRPKAWESSLLRRLKIERFKSIYEQDIAFGKVNLFVGPNGAGKSNILEALGVLSSALSSGLDPVTLDLRGVRLSLPHIFKSAFKNHSLPKTFRLEATFDSGSYECSIRASATSPYLEFFSEALYDGNRQVFGRSAHGTKLHSVKKDVPSFDKRLVASNRSVWSVIEPLVKISEELRSELEQFSKYAIYAPQTAIMRGIAIDQRVVEPLGLTGSGLAAALASLSKNNNNTGKHLRELLKIIWEPGWADQIQWGPFKPEIVPNHIKSEGSLLYIRDRFMHADRNMLSAFDASEGTLYLIFVALLIAHPQTPNVFALDNVDGTLNPSLVRKLSAYLVERAIDTETSQKHQVFVTSHHPSSLDSFDIFDENQKIFVCSRQKGKDSVALGSTKFVNLRPPENMSREEWNLKHRGRNLSELLLGNRIDGAL